MTVTKIEAVTKSRYKVYVDEQFAFVLYKGELSRYHVTEGSEITTDIYEEIRKEVIIKRAKLRALHLLNSMGRTEMQLRKKLKDSDYTDDVVEEAIKYVKSFGYINDTEYARSFVLNRKDKKSRKELYMLLCQKGLASEILDEVFEELYDEDSSKEAIRSILRKKNYNPDTADKVQTQKILGYLTRKGFSYEDIRQVLQVSEWNA